MQHVFGTADDVDVGTLCDQQLNGCELTTLTCAKIETVTVKPKAGLPYYFLPPITGITSLEKNIVSEKYFKVIFLNQTQKTAYEKNITSWTRK